MSVLVRRLLIVFLIVLVSTYSFNAERVKDPDLARVYFRKGEESLKILNYRDALVFFSISYSVAPESYYGELSFLYLGKSYALYSYAFGSRKGVLAAIGFLNQYPFYYKVPRFVHVQREFVADSYLLLQWYDTAKNIYANLYGETEKVEYMIKFGYASSLGGSIEGFNYLKELSKGGVPSDYLDLYYITMGFYNFNLGRYRRTVGYLIQALNLNAYLRGDPHFLFRLGVSYYKLGEWRKALLYLEMTLRNDPLNAYKDRSYFYLANINLETKNFREAYSNIRKLTENGKLFYLKLSQILFSSLWYYEDFLKVYGKKLGDYRNLLLQLGWLNVEDVYGDLPTLGIYYLSVKSGNLREEEREFLRVKKLTLREFVFENDLFRMERFLSRCRKSLGDLKFYRERDAKLISELYRTNTKNFLRVFSDQKSLSLLARSLVFLGDEEARKILPFLRDEGLRDFLTAKLNAIRGNHNRALELLRRSLPLLKGEDRREAQLLLGYLKEDPSLLEKVIKEIDFGSERFAPYRRLVLLRLADLFYRKGDLNRSLGYYREVVRSGVKDRSYWWAMFRLALLSERMKDEETLKWVVKRAKEEDNIWSRVIRTLWEG